MAAWRLKRAAAPTNPPHDWRPTFPPHYLYTPPQRLPPHQPSACLPPHQPYLQQAWFGRAGLDVLNIVYFTRYAHAGVHARVTAAVMITCSRLTLCYRVHYRKALTAFAEKHYHIACYNATLRAMACPTPSYTTQALRTREESTHTLRATALGINGILLHMQRLCLQISVGGYCLLTLPLPCADGV